MKLSKYAATLLGLIAVPCLWADYTPISTSQVTTIIFPNPYSITSLMSTLTFSPPMMAHPVMELMSVNVDNKRQRLLLWRDLFSHPEQALRLSALYAQTYFQHELSATPLAQAELTSRLTLIETGATPTIEHYRHWNLLPKYIKITFERGQIEPSYYGAPQIDIPLSLFGVNLNHARLPGVFSLRTGDLLFQDLACGELCDGINSTTTGYKETQVSHVGMVINVSGEQPQVIEAIESGVKVTSLIDFLLRSTDGQHHPRVMVGRVDTQTARLIPAAIQAALRYQDQPYNPIFSPTGPGLYCSQLISRSFADANRGHPVFRTHPMNFKTLTTGQFSSAWVNYFHALNQPIPQGQLGNNPGMLSRDHHLKIIYFYGDLRPQNKES